LNKVVIIYRAQKVFSSLDEPL